MKSKQIIPAFFLIVTIIVCSCKIPSKVNLGGAIYHGTNYITLNQFADSLKNELDGKVFKYAFVIRYKLAVVAREAGKKNNGPNNFTVDTKYNPASVTKTITAVALLQLLERKHLTIDDAIGPYLPQGWNNPLIAGISFRQVLTHSAGFPLPTIPDNVDYNTIHTVIMAGPQTTPTTNQDDALLNTRRYKNVNYGLCRILVDYLDGYNPANFSDQADGTAQYFRNYLQQNIFDKLKIQNISFTPAAVDAAKFFTYPAVPNDMGSDFGDWRLIPGSAGIQLSTREMAEFMFYLNLDNTLLADNMKSQMKSLLLGWDDTNTFENDRFVSKGGFFPVPMLRSRIYLFENGLQITIVINGDPNADVVSNAYTKAWNNSQH